MYAYQHPSPHTAVPRKEEEGLNVDEEKLISRWGCIFSLISMWIPTILYMIVTKRAEII